MTFRIFGREPAVWLNLAASLIAAASAFGLHFTVDQQGALNTVVAGVVALIVGVATKDSWAPLALGLIKAGIMAALAFHFHLPADTQAVVFGVASAILAMFGTTTTQASRTAVAANRPVGEPVRTAPIR